MCPLILVLNHVGGQSFNILSVIISNNVCVIIPTNTLKKILSKSTTLYFLFIFRREKNQTNPIEHFNQSVSLAYFSEWSTKKNVYSVNKQWQREHSELTNVYFKKLQLISGMSY